MENLSQNWWVIAVVLGVVGYSMASYAFQQWIAQRDRTAVLAAIEAAYRAGKDPDPALLKLVEAPKAASKQDDPWTNFWTFAALTAGFGFAAWNFQGDPNRGVAFTAVAIAMGVTMLAMLGAALRQRKIDGPRRDA